MKNLLQLLQFHSLTHSLQQLLFFLLPPSSHLSMVPWGVEGKRGMALRRSLKHGKAVLALALLCARLHCAGQPEDWEQINLTNNSPATARPAELMAEEVAK